MSRGSDDRWTADDAEISRVLSRAGGRLPAEPWGEAPNVIATWRALRSAIMVVTGDIVEARDEADLALGIAQIRTVDRARALSARGTANVLMSGTGDGIPDIREALKLIPRAGAKNTTLHAGILVNLAIAYATAQDRRARWTSLKATSVRSAAKALDPEWAREVECIEDFNDLQMRQVGMNSHHVIEQYSELARRCAGLGVKRIEGMARAEVAAVLHREEQYTSSLFFSEGAAAAFDDGGFDALSAGTRVAKAHVLQGLGLDVSDEIGSLLNYTGTRSGLLFQQMSAHSIYAEYLAHLGESAGAVAAYKRAHAIGLRLRSRGYVAPALAERLGAAMGGLYRARLIGMDTLPWTTAFQLLKDDVAGTVWGEHQTAILDLALAMSASDAEGVAASTPVLDQVNDRMPVAFAAEKLQGLRELATSFVQAPSLERDLEEYRDHVRHLVGEQAEEIRVSYRNANIVPVLNRILWTRANELTAWAQFRLVEYSRWGSLPPRAVPDDETRARDAKSVSEAALRAEGQTYATSMAGDGSSTDVRFASLHLTAEDYLRIAGDAIAGCGWVGQLYLSGSRLAWAGLDVANGRVVSGRRQLEEATIRALRLAPYWIAPNFGSEEIAFLAGNGLGPKYATTLAAARVAAGPFVQDHQLARDYLLGLPRPAHAAARNWLRSLDVPDFDSLCEGLGGLFDALPPEISRDDSPIALSVAGHLRGVPISLAHVAGRPLGCRRSVVTMPPLSVLSYSRPETALPDVGMAAPQASQRSAQCTAEGSAESPASGNPRSEPWQLTRLGNVGFASGFAPRSNAREVVDALTASTSTRHAVLYSGHIARGTAGGASSAGIPLGEGANLTAAALLRAENIRVPARVGIVGCEGAGWNLSDEWGGLAAALLLRGSRDVVASDWTILDTAATPKFDDAVAAVLARNTSLESGVQHLMQDAYNDWSQDKAAIPPQLWASLRVMRR